MYRWVEAVGKTWPKDANSQLPTRNSRLPWYSRFYSITLGGAKELWRCFWWIFSRFLFTFHCLILVEFHTLGNRMLWLKYIYILYLYYTYIYINYLYIYIYLDTCIKISPLSLFLSVCFCIISLKHEFTFV